MYVVVFMKAQSVFRDHSPLSGGSLGKKQKNQIISNEFH